MQNDEDFYDAVRDIVVHNTGRPPYLCSDEEWVNALDEAVGRGLMHPDVVFTVCPHCLSVAPYGDERDLWVENHLESHLHRWWWKLRRRKETDGEIQRPSG